MTQAVTIEGSSDDLIEIGGDIYEEFGLSNEDDGDLLAFSDGTILRIAYTQSGVWRIALVHRGQAELNVAQAPENDDDSYTDVATLTGDIQWVVHGRDHATARK